MPPAGTAGSDHDDDDNAVQIVTDDAAVTDTEAELAAEAHKAKMLSQLVKAANQANYTSFMLLTSSVFRFVLTQRARSREQALPDGIGAKGGSAALPPTGGHTRKPT